MTRAERELLAIQDELRQCHECLVDSGMVATIRDRTLKVVSGDRTIKIAWSPNRSSCLKIEIWRRGSPFDELETEVQLRSSSDVRGIVSTACSVFATIEGAGVRVYNRPMTRAMRIARCIGPHLEIDMARGRIAVMDGSGPVPLVEVDAGDPAANATILEALSRCRT